MLRALIWKYDHEIRAGRKMLETGHDLRLLLNRVASLGILRDDEQRSAMKADIQHVAERWFNNMRFLPTAKLQTCWWKSGLMKRKLTFEAVGESLL